MFGLNIDPRNLKGNPEPSELRDLGVQMVRYTFYDSSGGDQVDPARVQFYRNRAGGYHQVGIKSLVILTYDTYPNRPAPESGNPEWDQYIDRFARRATQIAQVLSEWSPAFQVWNEPDHPVHPGYAPTLREEVFGRMLRRTYDAIKSVNPAFTVVTGGLASGNPSWLTRVIQSQGGRLPADAVAFHPYGQRPDRNWPHPNWAFGYVGDLLNSYYRAGQQKPLWITEMGVKEQDVSNNRSQAAEFLRRYYQAMTTRYSDKVQQLHWFCYSDGMVPTFGLTDANGQRKPAYDAFRQIAATAAPAFQSTSTLPAVTPAPPAPSTPPPPLPPMTTPAPPSTISTPPPPVLPTPPVSQPVTPPTTLPAPPTPTPMPTVPMTGPSAQEVAQLAAEMARMQGQIAQVQSQVQQLLVQHAQIQARLKQVQGQPQPPVEIGPPPSLPTGPTGPAQPPIQNITEQLMRHANKRFPTRPQSRIQRLIVHHTAVPPSVGAARIAQHRVTKQDWAGIGYHYFITGEGIIQQTNALTTLSSHAGRFDSVSVGICFAGNFTDVAPAPGQIEAGAQLIAWLLGQLRLTPQALFGYKELVNTQSPGIQWDNGAQWGDQLRAQVLARTGG